jgi:hypothetical protein
MSITFFLQLQAQLRVLHWQTKSFAEHKALGKAYAALDPLVDQFIEVHSGRYGNTLAKTKFEFSVYNLKDTSSVAVIDNAIAHLAVELPNALNSGDSDLLNIRDEMVAVLNQTKYLLRMT